MLRALSYPFQHSTKINPMKKLLSLTTVVAFALAAFSGQLFAQAAKASAPAAKASAPAKAAAKAAAPAAKASAPAKK